MEKIKGKIVPIIIVLAIIGYLIVLYPAIVEVDDNGDTICHSIAGLTVGC